MSENADILAKLAASNTRVYVTYRMPHVIVPETGEAFGDKTDPMDAKDASVMVASLENLGCVCTVWRAER